MPYLYRKEDIMPVTEKKYPEWVQKHRVRGTTVKKKGDTYYLYKRTSRRVPGKKYPQPVDTYIGVITPQGVVPSNKKKVTLSDAEVWEYGFSKALWELCPDGWKKPLGKDWEDVLSIITLKWSPRSYIQRAGNIKKETDFRYQFGAQMASLSRRIYKEWGVGIEELHRLDSIYLVLLGKHEVISKISEGQKELLGKIRVSLEMC